MEPVPGKHKREEDQFIHEKFPVRKKFVKQASGWGTALLIFPVLIAMGWIPPTTAADMKAHEERHDKDFHRLEKHILDHEKIKKHTGAPSRKDFEEAVGNLGKDLKAVDTEQKNQKETIHKIQLDVATMKSDVGHIKDDIGEIKGMLQRER